MDTDLKSLVLELFQTWPLQIKKPRLEEYGTFVLTLEFAIYIIFFADKSIFVHNIKFFACRKLFSTDHTCETLKMKNFIPGATYEIIWWNTLRASGTFCSISSEIEKYFFWKMERIFLIYRLIAWCLTPTFTIFKLYRGVSLHEIDFFLLERLFLLIDWLFCV